MTGSNQKRRQAANAVATKKLAGTRLDADEYRAVKDAADGACLSVDSFVRARLFATPIRRHPAAAAVADLQQMVEQIKQSGENERTLAALQQTIVHLSAAVESELNT